MRGPALQQKVCVGGAMIAPLSRAQWAAEMSRVCIAARENPRAPFVVFSVNGQVIAKRCLEPDYRALLEQADALDADGQPLVIASRLLTRTPLPERVATTDFFHDAAMLAEAQGLRFFFLGATPENIEVAVARIKTLYPKLAIAGYRNGYFTAGDEAAIIKQIVTAQTDVLWVGLGVPRQEAFVLRNRQALTGVGWVKTCGGLFDYFTPHVKRAPRWMQACALEWLFRSLQEPRKYLWRYLTTNPVALWMLLTRTRDV
jgi:exopolysaccharide biosynthesis WecB/TagA/CpsF family protein